MSAVRHPDKPSPIGCVIGLLALLPAAFSGVAFWGAYRAFGKEPPLAETGKTLILWGIMALVPALSGIGFFVYRLLTVGKRETRTIGRSLSTGV
jgi:hypothetical protein